MMEYQSNLDTGKNYEGRNQAELLGVKAKYGYQSNVWCTFVQARKHGRSVKSGEHSKIHVCLGLGTFEEKDKHGKLKTVSRPLGFKAVFNLDQTEVIK